MGAGAGDKAKGRVKKAIGDLTDDERLRREGQGDEAAGKVKDTVDDVVDRVRGKKR
jgi:uncharacterized protein YjbJ (UPF0337 family)